METELATQSVLVFGTASTERLLEALSTSGRKTRLIGQGSAAGASRWRRRCCLTVLKRCARAQGLTMSSLVPSGWTCARCASRLLQSPSSRASPGTTATLWASFALSRCAHSAVARLRFALYDDARTGERRFDARGGRPRGPYAGAPRACSARVWCGVWCARRGAGSLLTRVRRRLQAT